MEDDRCYRPALTATLLPGRQSHTAPRCASHERPLTEGTGLFPSLMPELLRLQPQHTLVFWEFMEQQGIEGKHFNKFISGSCMFHRTGHWCFPHIFSRLPQCTARALGEGQWAPLGTTEKESCLGRLGLLKQLTPSASSLQLVKRIEEPRLSHTNCPSSFLRATGFPCPFLGAQKGAQEAPPSAHCLSSSLPKSQAGLPQQCCF